MTVPGLLGLAKAEGVSQAVVGGMERIVIVGDDGNRQAGCAAAIFCSTRLACSLRLEALPKAGTTRPAPRRCA